MDAAAKASLPFGTWKSPISPAMMAQGNRLSDVAWNRAGNDLVWLEGRSDRGVLVVDPMNGDAPLDLTDDLSVRAKVGYGGGDFTTADDAVIFVEAKSGRLFRQPLFVGAAQPITPPFGQCASPVVSPDGKWIAYVHSNGHTDCIAMVDAQGNQWPQRIVTGADFYMQPTFSPDGTHLAWVCWNHPNMPWDGTQLCVADLDFSTPMPTVKTVVTLAGDDQTAVFQPQFSPDGTHLAYISDATGWGNLYVVRLADGMHRPLTHKPCEMAVPAWVQGLRTYGFSPDGTRIYVIVRDCGVGQVVMVDVAHGELTEISGLDEYTSFDQIAVHPTADRLALIASSPAIAPRLIVAELPVSKSAAGVAEIAAHPETHDGDSTGEADTIATVRIVRRSMSERVPIPYFAAAEVVSWPADGATIHGLYYRPTNPDFAAEGLPPAILLVHGGPTSAREVEFDLGVQFFTSRGYAVLQINYRGSTGYGRDYMTALRGQWGVYDLDDTIGAARFLAEKQLADPSRLVVMGGSAGGYTVLRALTMAPGQFKAGVCLYGVSDLFALAAETHKFESRYNDTLVGALPHASAIYRDRSPIFAADRISDAIAVYQGADDTVVPKNQSDRIVESLVARRVPHEYTVYEGEGHGWRRSETIVNFYETLDAFLRRHVIFA